MRRKGHGLRNKLACGGVCGFSCIRRPAAARWSAARWDECRVIELAWRSRAEIPLPVEKYRGLCYHKNTEQGGFPLNRIRSWAEPCIFWMKRRRK